MTETSRRHPVLVPPGASTATNVPWEQRVSVACALPTRFEATLEVVESGSILGPIISIQASLVLPELQARISNYEIAARMQTSVTDVLDLSQESEETKKHYGLDHPHKPTANYARRCLMARRLVEKGVRSSRRA